MARWFRSLVCVVCMLSPLLGVRAQGVAAEPRNIVSLTASGQVETVQDWLTLVLSVTREGAEAAVVQSQLREVLEQALAALRPQAVSGQMEVRSGAWGLQPRYGKEGRIVAWVGSAELVLEGRDFARIGTAAGRMPTLTVASMQFSLSREARSQSESQAQALALDRFKARAQELARGFGFAGYRLREVTVSGEEPMARPMPRMLASAARAGMAEAPVPLEAGKTWVQVSVSGAIQLQ